MKIAVIGHKRIPSNEGGIEKGVEQHEVVTMCSEKNLIIKREKNIEEFAL